jgi:hypothetical protein
MYKPRGARRRRKRERKGTNVHHVLAQSLYPQYRRKEWNKVVLPKEEHFWYHKLFGNRTPEEIIDFLKEHFWGGNFNEDSSKAMLKM